MQITIIYGKVGVFFNIKEKCGFDLTKIDRLYMIFDASSNCDRILGGVKTMLLAKDYPSIYHNISGNKNLLRFVVAEILQFYSALSWLLVRRPYHSNHGAIKLFSVPKAS
jgi:hypothetical protein